MGTLYARSIPVTDEISVHVPTVGEVLDCEEEYLNVVSAFTSMPVDYMVALDDAGIDFEKVSAFELFLMLFEGLKEADTSLVIPGLDLNGFAYRVDGNGNPYLENGDGVRIDCLVHGSIAAELRKINRLEKNNKTPGNKEAKKYMLERARIKAKRRKGKKLESQMEDLIVTLVNSKEFPYNYETVRGITLFQFNASVSQIINRVRYDNLMTGVYTGNIDTKKISKSELSFLYDSSAKSA